jgi:hypothetical protein
MRAAALMLLFLASVAHADAVKRRRAITKGRAAT